MLLGRSSIIRTVTVGSGVSPDLLTLRSCYKHKSGSARGLFLACMIQRQNYRRWGISPRPEVRLM